MHVNLTAAFLAAGIGLVGIGSVSAAPSNGFVVYQASFDLIPLYKIASGAKSTARRPDVGYVPGAVGSYWTDGTWSTSTTVIVPKALSSPNWVTPKSRKDRLNTDRPQHPKF